MNCRFTILDLRFFFFTGEERWFNLKSKIVNLKLISCLFMKKWNEFSGSEKRMIIVLGVLVILIVLTFGRVNQGVRNGFSHFFSIPADTVQEK